MSYKYNCGLEHTLGKIRAKIIENVLLYKNIFLWKLINLIVIVNHLQLRINKGKKSIQV